ncbi:Intradiol ring-cleavage dioxygenase [Elsinoe ampelina]|uniref:Intradiol ring-cleavage dioxygenase n=1 Tax=Elsinoe ampelina TaxID=302913 RepID=A0A6A6GLU0_9PEZI|nr:Intradiol ring-cleavage dioxygenase [Elsinoe ampelina]
MVKINTSLLLGAGLAGFAAAHPGEHEHHDEAAVAAQIEYGKMIKRGLQNCESSPAYQAIHARAQERRWEKAQKLRQKRGIALETPYKARLRKRDSASLNTFAAENHNKTGEGYTTDTSSSDLFASYKNSSCILTPEVTYGPYYVSGEHYRTNVVEDQEGVPVHIEYQYIDVETCEVATGLYIETWSTNATGVYAGVVASGNGDQSDTSNLNKTFQRGVTKVDSDGVGFFDVLFPGYYTGRTTHIHLMTHLNGTVFENKTFQSDNVVHVGQLFFDEDLIDAVNAVAPYNTNTQTRTYNADDSIAQQGADNNYDPFPDWTYLGSDISDGILAWIAIGINKTASTQVTPAAYLTSSGGVANTNSGMGGGSGGPPSGGNGTSGGPPSGTPPNGTGSPASGSGSGNGSTATVSGAAVSATGGSTGQSGAGGPPSGTAPSGGAGADGPSGTGGMGGPSGVGSSGPSAPGSSSVATSSSSVAPTTTSARASTTTTKAGKAKTTTTTTKKVKSKTTKKGKKGKTTTITTKTKKGKKTTTKTKKGKTTKTKKGKTTAKKTKATAAAGKQ